MRAFLGARVAIILPIAQGVLHLVGLEALKQDRGAWLLLENFNDFLERCLVVFTICE